MNSFVDCTCLYLNLSHLCTWTTSLIGSHALDTYKTYKTTTQEPKTPRQRSTEESFREAVARAARGHDSEHASFLSAASPPAPSTSSQSQLAQLVFNAKAGTQLWTSPSNARVVLTGADGRLHEVNLSADSVALC